MPRIAIYIDDHLAPCDFKRVSMKAKLRFNVIDIDVSTLERLNAYKAVVNMYNNELEALYNTASKRDEKNKEESLCSVKIRPGALCGLEKGHKGKHARKAT